jgi:hypothetical protein
VQKGKPQSIDLLSAEQLTNSDWAKDPLENLLSNLRAIVAATQHACTSFNIGLATIPIYNKTVAPLLRNRYSSKEFTDLYDIVDKGQTFLLQIDATTGLASTCGSSENWDMSGRQWLTDSLRCADIQRDRYPQTWAQCLLTLCAFYNQPVEHDSFKRCIADPDHYRRGPISSGVAHVFIKNTLARDPKWIKNNRLESHGLALEALCDTVIAGVDKKQAWGISPDHLRAEHQRETLVATIANLANYLRAINTDPATGRPDFAAPTSGAWEQLPFAGGLTWDIEAMRAGLNSLANLLFANELEGNQDIALVRRLIMQHPGCEWLRGRQQLDALIGCALDKVRSRLFDGPTPYEHPSRPADAALAFISTSSANLSDSFEEDIARQFKLLEFVESRLVRSNGMLRYEPFEVEETPGRFGKTFDSYLADNYWFIPSLRRVLQGRDSEPLIELKGGHTNTPADHLNKSRLARPGLEAEWFMVSVMSEGYSRQVSKLLRRLESGIRDKDNRELQLLQYGHTKAVEFINRSYARITGERLVKANGRACPAFAVPEAFEYVSTLAEQYTTTTLPGVHTPLTWAIASLYGASKLLRSNLLQIEDLRGEIPTECDPLREKLC